MMAICIDQVIQIRKRTRLKAPKLWILNATWSPLGRRSDDIPDCCLPWKRSDLLCRHLQTIPHKWNRFDYRTHSTILMGRFVWSSNFELLLFAILRPSRLWTPEWPERAIQALNRNFRYTSYWFPTLDSVQTVLRFTKCRENKAEESAKFDPRKLALCVNLAGFQIMIMVIISDYSLWQSYWRWASMAGAARFKFRAVSFGSVWLQWDWASSKLRRLLKIALSSIRLKDRNNKKIK